MMAKVRCILCVKEARFRARRPFHNEAANHQGALERLKPELNQVYRPEEKELYKFYKFSRIPQPNLFHFQLRNMLGSATAFEHYFVTSNRIMQYNSISDEIHEVLDPTSDKRTSVRLYSDILFCTLALKHDMLCIGGLNGEILSYSLLTEGVTSTQVVCEPWFESSIINALSISRFDGAAPKLVAATNCNSVQVFRAEDLSLFSEHVDLFWPANFACLNPKNQNMMAVVGDACDGLMYDLNSAREIAVLGGHMDYCFAIAWHPDGQQFVTGSQDKTVRVWDVRRLDQAVDVLPCIHAEVRSLQYSSDGKHLAVAEPQDVVSIYDSRFTRRQNLSFFGDIAGVSFSPDDTTLMIGLQDFSNGGMLELVIAD